MTEGKRDRRRSDRRHATDESQPLFIDLSRPLEEAIAVFPGDVPFMREQTMHISNGDSVTLSSIRSTLHVGAHVDGENHYKLGGRPVDEWPIERFVGPAQVITAKASPGERVRPEDLSVDLAEGITRPRVLIRTGSAPDHRTFNLDFNGLSIELVRALASAGVILVGVDTPSVDPADSKDLPAHEMFARKRMTILEGLDLTKAPDGDNYELIALPLRIVGGDGSPVRAVLRTVPSQSQTSGTNLFG